MLPFGIFRTSVTEGRLDMSYIEFVGVENGELGFYSGEGA